MKHVVLKTPLRDLRSIRANDPDGGDVKPTPERVAAFHDWVRRYYTDQALKDYLKGGWEPQSEV